MGSASGVCYLIGFICFLYLLHLGSFLYALTASLGTYIIVVSPILKLPIVGGVVAKHVMLVRLLQPLNASSPMLVTLLGIVYSVIPFAMNILSSPSMIRHLPSSDAFAP